VTAWCPVEVSDNRAPVTTLEGVEQLTVFLRANVAFPAFSITINNVGPHPPQLYNASAPSSAASIWSVADIVSLAGSSLASTAKARNSLRVALSDNN
jgi:hypothetical protein